METMTHTPLNVDLKKMDYETFKTFMRELAQMYSNVKDDAYLLFYHNLRDLAKEVSTLPRNPLIFYGAYEIANNQVVVAIFEMQFTDEVISRFKIRFINSCCTACSARLISSRKMILSLFGLYDSRTQLLLAKC